MNKMLVGINYTDDGSRVISRISYSENRDDKTLKDMSELMQELNDEVYIVDFNPSCEPFINEIVAKGCRL